MATGPSPLSRTKEWWLALPLGRRLNVMLYVLAGVAAAFLIGAVMTGDGDDTGQVAAGPTTTSSDAGSSTSVAPTTTTTVGGSTTTAGETTTTVAGAPTTTAGRGGPTTTRRGAGTTAPTSPPPSSTSPPQTTTTTIVCRNSQNPACGEFRWDPAPAANQSLTISLGASPMAPQPNQEVTFSVRVEDPDHLVDNTCATIDFGDGSPTVSPGTCPHPPACPPHFGPWTPPPAQPGVYGPTQFARHTYAAPGTYLVTVTFFSITQDRCPDLDPYSSSGGGSLSVTVASPTTTAPPTTAPPAA